MIIASMLFAIVVSILVGLGALAIEHVAVGTRRRARFVWVGAMLLSVVWPVALLVMNRISRSSELLAPAALTRSVNVVSSTVGRVSQSVFDLSIDTLVVTAWIALSIAFVARVVYAVAHTRRRVHQWKPVTVDGIAVHTSRDVGPAVVGFSQMRVVVPEWIMSLDGELRDLVLVHEEQHRVAGDPYLLLFATALVALMPWNVALVWQARRLRLAIELDCDARVLRLRPNVERYARLVLAVAQRRANMPSLLASTMSEPANNLSRRISAMRQQSMSRVRVGALLVLGGVAIVAACTMDAPSAPAPKAAADASATVEGEPIVEHGQVIDSVEYVYVTTPGKKIDTVVMLREKPGSGSVGYAITKIDSTTERPVTEMGTVEVPIDRAAKLIVGTANPRYPAELKAANIEGEVVASFVVDADGRVDESTFRVMRASDPRFVEAAKDALREMRFEPAIVGGRAVRQVQQMPFTWSLK